MGAHCCDVHPTKGLAGQVGPALNGIRQAIQAYVERAPEGRYSLLLRRRAERHREPGGVNRASHLSTVATMILPSATGCDRDASSTPSSVKLYFIGDIVTFEGGEPTDAEAVGARPPGPEAAAG